MKWQPVGTSLARHWPMGQKWIGPIKEAIGGPMRRHSLTIHWPNQVVLSGVDQCAYFTIQRRSTCRPILKMPTDRRAPIVYPKAQRRPTCFCWRMSHIITQARVCLTDHSVAQSVWIIHWISLYNFYKRVHPYLWT